MIHIIFAYSFNESTIRLLTGILYRCCLSLEYVYSLLHCEIFVFRMPLGFFGGNSSNGGPKPQPLTSEKEKKYKDVASTSAGADLKDNKGSTVKLGKKSYVVEKRLAEGGYAIVYLVSDKKNRLYALKRQLIRDDPRQIEACRTEAQIVVYLSGLRFLLIL